MEKRQFDVTALGELLIDFTENGFSSQGNPLMEANPGGAPCNVLAMLERLGKKTAFIGKVGKDMFGNQLKSAVEEVGIDTRNLILDEKYHTTLAFVHTYPDGDRDFSFYRDPGADMMLTKDEVQKELIESSRIFHFGTLSSTHEGVREATRHAIELAKEAGCIITFDPNLRPPLWKSLDDAEQDLRDLMKIPDNYKVLFLQGGASQQFAMIPMNLMKNRVADYIVTGQWAKKAYQEAQKYGKVNKIASSEDKTFSYIPDCSDLPISPDADYVYICENNTIYGTKFKTLPNTKGKTLVADVSSCFLSEPVDVSKYGIIYGGVQKNIGPAGMVIAIIREDLITEDVLPGTPTMLTYKTHADAGSLYNTPNAYCIYVCGKVFKWLKAMGGLEEMQKRNIEKAKILYDYLDQSKLFKGTVEPNSRSLMNVPFVTGDKDMDAKFVKEAKAAGLVNLTGHRTVGGMRASIYNAMPKEGVEALVAFMKKFEEENV